MSKMYPIVSIVDGQPTFKVPVSEIWESCKLGGCVHILDQAEFITEGQRKWWKGVLLPALAKDSGDSVSYWETRLKLAVLPEDFHPFYFPFGKQVFPVIPSITILGKKKTNILIEGSVEKCHEWGFE